MPADFESIAETLKK